jgi:branched-chain amino acid transport system ATP-binding protein
VQVLHDVSIQVAAGEVVTLLGRNGAGKSTTLLTLSGLLHPSGGTVLLNGRPVTGPAHRRARAGMSYVRKSGGSSSA